MTSQQPETGVGCRPAALSAGVLLVAAALLYGVGLWLTVSEGCSGGCERLALTMLYAGGPMSAFFGVLGGAVLAAWPLDVMVWLVLAWVTASQSERRNLPLPAVLTLLLAAALVYGFGLSFLVARNLG